MSGMAAVLYNHRVARRLMHAIRAVMPPGVILSSYEIFYRLPSSIRQMLLRIASTYPPRSAYGYPGGYVGAIAAEMGRLGMGMHQTRKVCPYLHRVSAAFYL